MLMQRVLMVLAVLTVGALQASAAENFIVRGHSYAPGSEQLPSLGSQQDELNLQTDLLEAQIYVQQRQQKLIDSEMSRFMSNPEFTGPDQSLEY